MKKLLSLFGLALFIAACTGNEVVEQEIYIEESIIEEPNVVDSTLFKSLAYLNFNVGSSTVKPQKKYSKQAVEIIGCNTFITNKDSLNWNGDTLGLTWDSTNQIFKNIPYGYQKDPVTDSSYYVSKYYIASPPVFLRNAEGKSDSTTNFDIGILTPNEFTLKGDKPVQSIYFDYDILKLVKIQYIKVNFDSTFDQLNISKMPFKVQAPSFPWYDKTFYENAKGASGVGYLDKNIAPLEKLFLPYFNKPNSTANEKEYLDFEIRILNDILLHHEIFFNVNDSMVSTLNLKHYFSKHGDSPITLHCEYKKELGCGCKPNVQE